MENTPRIAIIVGSIREGRIGSSIARWVKEIADQRGDATYEILELAEFDVPLISSPIPPVFANREYGNKEVQAWSQAIDSYDSFVFVTPEYNHSVPGPFKNAFDAIYPEWEHKAVGMVSYGGDGGVRAIEHWRQATANANLVTVRATCSLGLFTDFDGNNTFTPGDRRPNELGAMLDALLGMTHNLHH